jgi:hypothetical protein
MLLGCKGFVELSITPTDIFVSELFLVLLFDRKNGNPLSGRSLTIRYVLDRAWKIKSQKAYPTSESPTDGKKAVTSTQQIKAIKPKSLIYFLAKRISSLLIIEPSTSVISFSVRRDSKSSLTVPEKRLVLITMIRAIRENIRKPIKAKGTFRIPIHKEKIKGIIQGIRMEILFFVQNFLIFREASCIRLCLVFCLSHTTNFTIIEGLSQAHNPESLFSMPIEALWKGEV